MKLNVSPNHIRRENLNVKKKKKFKIHLFVMSLLKFKNIQEPQNGLKLMSIIEILEGKRSSQTIRLWASKNFNEWFSNKMY